MCPAWLYAGPDVICTARSDAILDGLLTVFHMERSATALENVQNTLPLLSDYDKEAIKVSMCVLHTG